MSSSPLDPRSEFEESPLEALNELRRENAYLIQRISELGRIQQELSEERHQLDQVNRRFQRMEDFMRRGLQADTREQLARIACEAMVDILECEAGLLCCFRCDQGPGSLFLSSGHEIGPEGRELFLEWTRQWQDREENNAPPPLPAALGYRDWLVQELRNDQGQLDGLVIAANTLEKSDFHELLEEIASRTLANFVSQLGTLMANRHSRDTIRRQFQQIRESEERLSLALESSNVGLWDWEIASGRVAFSEQFKRQLGYSGDEIPGNYSEWESRLHPLDRDQAIQAVRRFTESTRASYANVFRLQHKSGRWLWIAARSFALLDEQGRKTHVIGTHIDITSFKKLEDRLRRAMIAADRASAAKSVFLARVSHELRTPLNGILGSLQLLKTTTLSEEQRGLVDLGYSSGRWMMSIIGDGLDLARIEAGKMELVISPFNPERMLSELLLFQKASAAAKGLEMISRIDPAIPRKVQGDAAAFRQVAANLVGNAIKFSDQGAITVSLEALAGRRPGQIQLVLTVEDKGIGIPRNFIGRMFEPFQQVDPADGRRTGGIGLGLAVTRELVKLMGGSIQHQSPGGSGTRFTVTLPLAVLPDEQEPTPPTAESAGQFRGRILVVDDDEASRQLAALMLRKLGVEVETASNGTQGLQMLLAQDFDLAFVDCWMPGMGGLELARRIRNGPGTRGRIPIIALTANSQQSELDACISAGMDDCVVKPFLTASLRDCLVNHL
jgi:PAS domain S-box-containing protein